MTAVIKKNCMLEVCRHLCVSITGNRCLASLGIHFLSTSVFNLYLQKRPKKLILQVMTYCKAMWRSFLAQQSVPVFGPPQEPPNAWNTSASAKQNFSIISCLCIKMCFKYRTNEIYTVITPVYKPLVLVRRREMETEKLETKSVNGQTEVKDAAMLRICPE